MAYRVGVDIGGTFTDFCVFDEGTNAIRTLKVLSTPDTPGAEVLQGIRELERRFAIPSSEIAYFTHGTTVGINTVIQRKGAKLALFTTERFQDVLEVARLKMPDPYNLFSRRPVPLVTRDRVYGIRERVLADGTIDEPLDEGSVREALAKVRAEGCDAVVVALLHAYRNPVHERRIREILAADAPDLVVTCASEVWPVIREYERTVTATVGGYVQGRVARYLGSLQTALRDVGVPAPAMVTKSNGGVMSAELGKSNCVQMLLSGTASGVIGASHVARLAGLERVMSLDVGGTSADVALILSGEPQYGVGETVGEFPIYVPTVAVTSIGAGGGSIAHVDGFGVLKVGPESAGASPGPACYGRGGERATITDAFAVCGFLGSGDLGYGAVRLDLKKAEAAVGHVAQRIGRGLREAAEAIIRVAVSGMFMEVSKLTSRAGVDARDFALLAFGGAGPMMGGLFAAEIGMREVVVPTTPGVLSALGGLVADVKNDFIRTAYLDLAPGSVDALRRGYGDLARDALAWLKDEQGHTGAHHLLYAADMRYRGQSFEIETPLEGAWIEAGDLERIAKAFHARHEQVYDHADPEAPIQVINLRLVVVGHAAKPSFAAAPAVAADAEPAGSLDVFYDGQAQTLPLFHRADLVPGHRFAGPAVVTQDDCTTVVPAGYAGRIDGHGNIRLTRTAA